MAQKLVRGEDATIFTAMTQRSPNYGNPNICLLRRALLTCTNRALFFVCVCRSTSVMHYLDDSRDR